MFFTVGHFILVLLPSIPLLSPTSGSYQHDQPPLVPHRSAAAEEGEAGQEEKGKEEVKSSGTMAERVLYHVIMMLVSRPSRSYFCLCMNTYREYACINFTRYL